MVCPSLRGVRQVYLKCQDEDGNFPLPDAEGRGFLPEHDVLNFFQQVGVLHPLLFLCGGLYNISSISCKFYTLLAFCTSNTSFYERS